MDHIAANQKTFGCTADGPSAIPLEFNELLESLAACASASTGRLAERLLQARDAHDLTKAELIAAQRDVARLHRIGALPAPNEYWKRSALPRAALMIDASMAAIVEEGEALGAALDRFMVEVDESPLDRWSASGAGKATVEHVTAQAIAQLMEAVPPSDSIHALGSWWQRRLRRTAVRGAFPGVLASGSQREAVIGKREMELLDRQPWSHGDRLLSAFELAHNEIRTQTELVMEGLTARVGRRGKRFVAPDKRVTIELRD